MSYINEDAIAALSTASGKSAIAVIRLSGADAFEIIDKIFQTSSVQTRPVQAADKQIKYGYIVDGTEKKDEALCAFFKAPRTYTGENLVEISVHGNALIINEVLNLLYKNGARPAQAGEFTYRAFINGKKDLAQAEAVCALITGKTEKAVKAALNNLGGELSNKIKSLKDNLINLLAYVEASMDHPEEDIMFLSRSQKSGRLSDLIEQNAKLLSAYKISHTLNNGLKAAIIGKPNVGKSSLLNAILGKNRAIVTEIAGTTTDAIEEIIDCRGIPLTIIDTAGLRSHTNNAIEKLGQEKTKEALSAADIIIWVTDGSQPLDKNDEEIAEFLKNASTPIIAVENKCDLKLQSSKSVLLSSCAKPQDETVWKQSCNPHSQKLLNCFDKIKTKALNLSVCRLSAKTGDGVQELLDEIAKIAGVSDSCGNLMINARHYNLLQTAQSALENAKKQYTDGDSDEIAAFEIRNAAAAYEEILGITAPADILDAIFSTFCIGK
ncbi:MAG: tRNA uridine-5-carboxymethylaminomethyl(34) synthesis GTPase MnmE [Endomicrobium sp.]|jgi:tRNA modification GTPase|nr:tRNA uridine-5-carboxymethylaminomethyl(34) synthesis GTPase MnmE [Endomicrobium sp.]